MALTEQSVNHIKRNRRVIDTPPDSLSDDHRYPQTSSNGVKAGLVPTPSSIQSMLKNATEIGDIGQLAFQSRAARKPRMNGTASYAVQQTPLPTTSGSLRYSARKQQSKGITYGMPFERDVTSHGAVRSQPGTVSGASSIYSMYRNRSETSFRSQSQVPSRVPSRGPSRGLVPTDEPSYFTMQHSSNGRRNLADHPAHAFYQPRSPVAMHQMRPRSPYAYPSRLKRPGYRPSSPALSEVYRPAPRPPFGYQSATAHQGTSLRTVSPLSMYSMKVSPTVWQQGPNRSDPILGCQQLSPKERYLRGQEYQDISHGRLIEGIQTRTANMIPSEMYRSIDSVSTAEAPSPPLFYDYSEDFQQQSTYHAPALGPIFNETPEISENNNRRIYYELDNRNEGQSEPHITELPAEVPPSRRNFAMVTQPKERGASASALVEFVHKRLSHTYSVREAATRSDDPSFEQANRTSTRSSRFSAIDVGALRSLAVIEDATTDIKAAAVNMKTHPSASGLDGETRKQSHPSPEAHGEPLSVRHTVGHRILSSYKRSQEFLAGNPNRSTANTNISLYSRRSRSSSPSTGSIYSTGSPSIRGRNREPKADPGSVEASLQMQLGNAASALDAQKPLPEANWAIRPETAQTEIHCPVPKRSISSPSHRERFSSILSIDEGLLELDELAVKPEQQSVITTFSKAKTLGNRSDPSYPITSIQKSYPTLHDISEVQAPMPTHDGQDSHVGWVSSGSFVETGSGKQWAPPDDRASTHISNVAHPLTTTLPSKVMDTGESAKSSHNSLHRASGDPVMGTQPTLHSAISVTGGEYKNLDTTKELPLRPRSSIVSFAPLRQHDSVCLPFAFTPLRPEERDHDTDSVAELGRLAASYLNRSERFDSEPSATSPKMKLKVWSDQASLVSSLRSNLDQMDGEHSKAEGPLKLELPMTMTAEPLIEKSHSTMPRFTLKVHRASSSPACAVKITKPRPSTEAVIRASRESSSQRQGSSSAIPRPFSRKSKPKLSNVPTQNNSSRPSAVQTRFVESFDLPPQTFPAITLVPPSPGLNLEAQSFFSDDSSQMPPKGSFRKRISQIRAMASRGSVTDDTKGSDRRLLSSPVGKSRTSGRTSRQSAQTRRSERSARGLRRSRHPRRHVIQRLKAWLYRIKVRFTEHNRLTTADLYQGV